MLTTNPDQDQKAADILWIHNPSLCSDPEKIKTKIAEFDREIDGLIQSKPKDWEPAVNIHLQGRNALAVILGVESREVDCGSGNDATLLHCPVIPKDKIVALICDNEMVRKSLQQILPPILRDQSRFKIMSSREAIDLLICGKLAGIVDFNFTRGSQSFDIASYLRHDLKYRDGWNEEMADNLILPPLFAADVYQVFKGFDAALEMAEGTFHSSEVVDNKVNLADYRSSFIARMTIPKVIRKVIIIDDYETCYRGILFLLNIWPNIELSLIHDFSGEIPEPKPADILLLDHDLGSKKYNGGDLLSHWFSNGFRGVVVSTTGGDTQQYGSHHFRRKAIISIGHLDSCHEFISMINQILESLDS